MTAKLHLLPHAEAPLNSLGVRMQYKQQLMPRNPVAHSVGRNDRESKFAQKYWLFKSSCGENVTVVDICCCSGYVLRNLHNYLLWY